MKDEDELMPRRADARQFVAMVVITVATAIATGHTLRQPAFMTANDISRWCTVWSLLERGTYVIDDCPWQVDTQDKVEREGHFYSSKPALLSTIIAGILYPARTLSGVPLDKVVLQERAERWTQKPDPDNPGKLKGVLETPKDPVKWPAYIFYFKPVLILLNAIPFAIFLILFARVLDRYAGNDWAWIFVLIASAFGTYLLPYTQTLNNHTIGAFTAFFALYQFLPIWDEGELAGWRFAAAGFFAGFTASTELPALAFPALLGTLLLVRYPRQTLLYFLPGLIVPLAAFVGAQYVEFGIGKNYIPYLPYESFGSKEYSYEGSIWDTPLELDAFNKTPEPYGVYLFHMTLGHHGVFSLTPIFLLSAWGALRLLRGGGRFLTVWTWLTLLIVTVLAGYYLYNPAPWKVGGAMHPYVWIFLAIPGLLALLALLSAIILLRRGGEPMASVAWMTAVLTVVLLAFYTWNPKARNYGGSAQGLRWLFWLIPFWLLMLPKAVERGQDRAFVRRLALLALAISAISVGYAMRNPWSHPWILDAMEHLNLYPLTR
jgi:hypothetical protein